MLNEGGAEVTYAPLKETRPLMTRPAKALVKGIGTGATIILWLSAMAATSVRPSQVPSPNVQVPKTSAGEQFSAWLAAFNSGEREQIEKFRNQYAKPEEHPVDVILDFRQRTGGFELKKIEESGDARLGGLVQERDSDQFARFTIEVEPAPLGCVPSPTGQTLPGT